MWYGVFSLITGELFYLCDEAALENHSPKDFAWVEAPGRDWQQTHQWDSMGHTFIEIPAE